MNLDDALRTFIVESRGLIEDMEDALMQLELRSDDRDAINAVFRAAHTIKGSAGLFGLDHIVAFTHKLESLLVRVRDGKVTIEGDLIGLLLKSGDHISRLLDKQEEGGELDAQDVALGQDLATRLEATADVTASVAVPVASEMPTLEKVDEPRHSENDIWHVSLRLSPNMFRDGFDPASFINHLKTVGRIVHISTLTDLLPNLYALDPESSYLGFEIRLAGATSKEQIESVFDFVRDDCTLHILPPDSRVGDYLRFIETMAEDKLRLGEILVASGAVTQRELDTALKVQSDREPDRIPLGAILVDKQVIHPEVVQAALTKQNDVRQRQAQESKLIRVHADKLDALITLVGELVIAGSSVGSIAHRNKDRALKEAVSIMSRLTEEVRDGAMRLRMVEIGDTFNRFRRVVRDVSKELSKDIELVITGADTELDKSVVERMSDPLTHLVRNAIDHGIESPAVRLARGKPARGRVELKAYHEAGSIVIEINDDGGGLNRERILSKALEKGLIDGTAVWTDSQVWALVFEAGFSTADHVSNLSGRGVGMDVVRSSIEALRGTVEIESRAGQGATFRIRLPLTLAIIDGFLMGLGEGHYVVPLDMVLECVKLDPPASNAKRGNYLDMRGEVLPLLRLREHFDLDCKPCRYENVVIVQAGNRRAGLVVDALKGEFQAVIKPLGPLLEGLEGISGSTILGSGEVALVLDVPALLTQAIRAELRVPAPV